MTIAFLVEKGCPKTSVRNQKENVGIIAIIRGRTMSAVGAERNLERSPPMNDSTRKLLTEMIGECWHEWYGGPMFGGTIPADWPISEECKKCHTPRHFYAGHFGEMNQDTGHRTFTTWADLGAVKEAIVKAGKWGEFWHFAYLKWCDTTDSDADILSNEEEGAARSRWLFSDPSRFCELAGEWAEKERWGE